MLSTQLSIDASSTIMEPAKDDKRMEGPGKDGQPKEGNSKKSPDDVRKARTAAYMKKYRARQKEALISGTEDEKRKIEQRIENAKRRRKNRERATVDKKDRVMKTLNTPSQPAAIGKVSLRSKRKETGKKTAKDREYAVNREVTELFEKILCQSNDVEKIATEVTKKFVWFKTPTEFDGAKNNKKTGDDEAEDMCMWYKPIETEFHKWVSVKKSNLVANELDLSGGYGLFAERHFRAGNIISIYLGKYANPDYESDYCMDQKISSTTTKRIYTDGGYPRNPILYLGAHMLNDFNWSKERTAADWDDSRYNVSFNADLGLTMIKDVEPGDELLVCYNYDNKATA